MADVKICDRCGSVFENRKRWIYIHPVRHILRFMRIAVDPEDLDEYPCIDKKVDLCLKCTADLNLFLNGRQLMDE